jgi:hypothetical protein
VNIRRLLQLHPAVSTGGGIAAHGRHAKCESQPCAKPRGRRAEAAGLSPRATQEVEHPDSGMKPTTAKPRRRWTCWRSTRAAPTR